MLMNSTHIMVLDQMQYQLIRNDKSNNFLIQTIFPKLISIPIFEILIKFDQKSSLLIKIGHWKNGCIVTEIKKVIFSVLLLLNT